MTDNTNAAGVAQNMSISHETRRRVASQERSDYLARLFARMVGAVHKMFSDINHRVLART